MPTIQHLIGTMSAIVIMPLATTFAQTSTSSAATPPEERSAWIGVITADQTAVRCGANESYYPIATLKTGDLVKVFGKRQNWMKIETQGRVFDGTVGYVKYLADNATACEIDGDHCTVKSDVEVLANNIESEELYRSWRPVLRLQDGDECTIVHSIVTEPGTLHRESYVVHNQNASQRRCLD